ncbi:hypothetical protein BKA67DRAFT_61345 [Truncatella angustata]|uniref:BTB domain-containing protein n=1 Tax=Truncatella angustata TaxID=152316 RepID=A0A9P8UWM9_9PEZI|nr:uncharacterized protein BKA67DRAFT_61345 [Truncatella angustata]KAH6660654.1 hypothetical protein BKA67DRAFT_61345 [Truncatella angustata]KAH8199306.1 hypothetical protein TruAng_006542 [Truncatella angustata]
MVTIQITNIGRAAVTEVTCHMILFACFSRVMDREVRQQLRKQKQLAVLVVEERHSIADDFCKLVAWCYTGQLGDEQMTDLHRGNAAERLWNLAADLEMPEFANYCMRAILTKHTHSMGDGGDDLVFKGNEAPYEHYGLLHVHRHNRADPFRDSARARILCFMQRLLETHPPMSRVALVSTKNRLEYERGWYKAMSNDMTFGLMDQDLCHGRAQEGQWWIEQWDDLMIRTVSCGADSWKAQRWDVIHGEACPHVLEPVTVTRKLRCKGDGRHFDLSPFYCKVPRMIVGNDSRARQVEATWELVRTDHKKVADDSWGIWRGVQQSLYNRWDKEVRAGRKRDFDVAFDDTENEASTEESVSEDEFSTPHRYPRELSEDDNESLFEQKVAPEAEDFLNDKYTPEHDEGDEGDGDEDELLFLQEIALEKEGDYCVPKLEPNDAGDLCLNLI